MKLTKLGLLGEISSRRNQEVCLEGRPLVGLDATRDLVFMRALVITCYMIPKYSELFLPLSGSTNTSSVGYAVVL